MWTRAPEILLMLEQFSGPTFLSVVLVTFSLLAGKISDNNSWQSGIGEIGGICASPKSGTASWEVAARGRVTLRFDGNADYHHLHWG